LFPDGNFKRLELPSASLAVQALESFVRPVQGRLGFLQILLGFIYLCGASTGFASECRVQDFDQRFSCTRPVFYNQPWLHADPTEARQVAGVLQGNERAKCGQKPQRIITAWAGERELRHGALPPQTGGDRRVSISFQAMPGPTIHSAAPIASNAPRCRCPADEGDDRLYAISGNRRARVPRERARDRVPRGQMGVQNRDGSRSDVGRDPNRAPAGGLHLEMRSEQVTVPHVSRPWGSELVRARVEWRRDSSDFARIWQEGTALIRRLAHRHRAARPETGGLPSPHH